MIPSVRSLGVIIAGLLSLIVGSSTQAAFVSYSKTVTQPQTTTDFSVSLGLPSFDKSMGTLNDIVISYTDREVMNGFVQNTSASSQTFKVTENSTVTLNYGTTNLLTNNLMAEQSYTNLASTQSSQYGVFTPTGTAGPTTISSGPVFDAFLQPSSTVMFTLSTLTSTSVSGGGGNISTGIYTTVGATITITYEYTPASVVPEPSSLAMTCVGGALWIASRVRKARRKTLRSVEIV